MPRDYEYSNCPECGASLLGSPIPKEDQKFFGGSTNYRREIGVYDYHCDRVVAWECPICGHEWERTYEHRKLSQ